jgi:hypothetical protein
MKKATLLLLLAFITGNFYAQKTDTDKKDVKINIPKSEFFKNIKTYDIIIQGDDSWNKELAHKEKLTYEHYVTKNTIEDYSKKNSTNPDVRVLMGYNGATYKRNSNGQTYLDGDFKYLVLGKNNEIIFEKGSNAILYSPTYANVKPYVNLANDLNNIAYKYIKDNNFLSTEKEYTLNYGLFVKAENFPELLEFNTKTDDFLNKIATNSLDTNYLQELEKFYLGYVGKEYPKMKPKDYNKVIYLNLSLTEMFSLNFDKSLEYLENAKQGAGMMSLWPDETKANIESLITVNQTSFEVKVENPTYDSAYYINFNGTVTHDGTTQKGKIKVDRFSNTYQGNIMSLDKTTKPKVWIYKDNGEVDFVEADETTKITTDKGVELGYILYKNNYLFFEKLADSCYKKYESILTDTYCNKNGKFELKK